jgi:alkylation response protein AidB-like acyl-CoA dehydrogenase
VPEQYGGLDLDKVSSLIVAERMARSASFATTYGGQANLCILPIVLFGTESQKQTYLPSLVAGELVGAYALSESGSGSDALAARTRATREPDGTWTLNGETMWISNGGVTDMIIVFAKVDGEHFTAFIVEKRFPGVSAGKEEHKMGLHGSSTTAILLQDAKVPADNVLGGVGKGHKVALNDEQEVLGYAADIMIDTYAAESAVLRARAAGEGAHPHAGLHEAAARTFVNDAALRLEGAARNALAAMADGDTLRVLLAALRRVLKVTPLNTVTLRRRLAEASVERGRYILES